MSQKNALRRYHAAVWDEPIVMEMGVAGRRGCHFPLADDKMQAAVGAASDLVPQSMRRRSRPALPEMSEPDVLRHYLHLSQETMGMMGISLFGTCTMKYNPRLTEGLAARPFVADLHPNQDPATLQGVLQVIYEFDRMLRSLSGMDQVTFQPAHTRRLASHVPITQRRDSSVSARRSSPASSRIPAIRQRRPRRDSRSSRCRSVSAAIRPSTRCVQPCRRERPR
jgi:glycine dehydrogenase subunit 2